MLDSNSFTINDVSLFKISYYYLLQNGNVTDVRNAGIHFRCLCACFRQPEAALESEPGWMASAHRGIVPDGTTANIDPAGSLCGSRHRSGYSIIVLWNSGVGYHFAWDFRRGVICISHSTIQGRSG